ncbi:MAG: polysaccharide biosynthesis tyrosine autokinase [Anaerolineales bacterium]|jgi:capsular exopolysaccharide synthesis family protein|nr:polysaccharide biosynthesis tyrosine autokinase [Anaerolineales bacterium]
MEIKHYLAIAQRWAWLLVLGLVLGGAGAYLFSIYQTPVYQSRTKLLVIRAPQSQNSDLAYLASQQLAQTFIQLLQTRPVLDNAAQELGYRARASEIKAEQLRDTQVIILTVENNSPERAAAIANTLVRVLIEQNDSLQSSRYLSSEESLVAQVGQVNGQIGALQEQIDRLSSENVQQQIGQVEAKIGGLQSEIAAIESEIFYATNRGRSPDLASTESTARLAQLKSTLELYQEIYSNLLVLGKPTGAGASDRLGHLQKTLELYQQIYLQLLGSLEEVRLARLQNTPSIVQIEAAAVPSAPVRPLPIRSAALGAAVGLMLACGIAFGIEYLDDSLRSPVDVEQVLGLAVLGYIADLKLTPAERPRQLYVAANPRAPQTEAFRTLRSNIEFSGTDKPIKTILVTSSRPGEGKTTIASNLAAIYAQGGKRVLLVDADLRRPAIHEVVGIPNRLGLTTLFRDSVKPEHVWKRWGGTARGMYVITSGSLPDNPTELLGSEKMLHLIADLRQKADVIIFDGPPMMVSDSQIMAALVDAVVLVLRPGKSPSDEARSSLAQLKRSGANVIGVIFNRLPRQDSQHYGGYRYYSLEAYEGYQQSQPARTIRLPEQIPAYDEPATRPNGHRPRQPGH